MNKYAKLIILVVIGISVIWFGISASTGTIHFVMFKLFNPLTPYKAPYIFDMNQINISTIMIILVGIVIIFKQFFTFMKYTKEEDDQHQ